MVDWLVSYSLLSIPDQPSEADVEFLILLNLFGGDAAGRRLVLMLDQFYGDGWLRLLAVGYRSCGSWLGWFSHLALHYSCQGWDGYFEAFFSIWAAGCAVPMAGCFAWRVLFEGYGCIKSLLSQAICPCVAFIATPALAMLLAPEGPGRAH